MTEEISPAKGHVIASYLVKVTIRSEDYETEPPLIRDIEEAIEERVISAIGPEVMVRASAERTDK